MRKSLPAGMSSAPEVASAQEAEQQMTSPDVAGVVREEAQTLMGEAPDVATAGPVAVAAEVMAAEEAERPTMDRAVAGAEQEAAREKPLDEAPDVAMNDPVAAGDDGASDAAETTVAEEAELQTTHRDVGQEAAQEKRTGEEPDVAMAGLAAGDGGAAEATAAKEAERQTTHLDVAGGAREEACEKPMGEAQDVAMTGPVAAGDEGAAEATAAQEPEQQTTPRDVASAAQEAAGEKPTGEAPDVAMAGPVEAGVKGQELVGGAAEAEVVAAEEAADVDMSAPAGAGGEANAPVDRATDAAEAAAAEDAGEKPVGEKPAGADKAAPGDVAEEVHAPADEAAATEQAQPEAEAAQAAAAASGELQPPRKPCNAFALFGGSIRAEVLKEAEEKNGVKPKMGEVAKLIGVRWGALSEAEKNSWKDKATADKQRYEVEQQTYQELLDPVGTWRAKNEHLIPKKPPTFFGLWLEDAAKRGKAHALLVADGKQATKQHVMAKLGSMWRTASEEAKAPFYETAKKLQTEFEQKTAAWEASPECAELGKLSKEQEARDAKDAAAKEAAACEAEAKKRGAARGAKKPQAKDAATPTKRANAGLDASPADAKKPRTTAAKPKEPQGVPIDEATLTEATKLGWESQLRNLAARPEVLSSGKSAGDILESLQASKGLVNAAKRTLLGC